MRNLLGILKDKVSLIKAALLLSTKPPTSLHVAVLRATAHHPAEPPPDYTVDYVLSIGHHHRPTATTVVDTILRRLHRTHTPNVAIKCLLTLHHILIRGSPVLKSQLTGSLLNLSTSAFHYDDAWELSRWARWYAEVLEQSLKVSLPPLTSQTSETRLLTELNSLVSMVEQINRAPESLYCQRMGLIYEVMKLVGEDYRISLREIIARINMINDKISGLNEEEMVGLMGDLKRLEGCQEKLFLMFLNKKRHDGSWDLIAKMRRDVERENERRENMRLVGFQNCQSKPLVMSPAPRGRRWLDVGWNPLVVSLA